MELNRARKFTLPVLSLVEVCEEDDIGSIARDIPLFGTRYYFKSIIHDNDESLNFNQVDMVLSRDGSPWVDACLFILDRLIDRADDLHTIQKSNLAGDLATFREFIEDYSIDYLFFPKHKLQRPTYRYRAFLKNKVRTGEIAKSTAQRLMQTVVLFYRWLSSERYFTPQNPCWVESFKQISFTDHVGFHKVKSIKTTDLSIKGHSALKDVAVINDGGSLRPLNLNEQKVLIDCLLSSNNLTMTLIMLMALFSGARIQTVLTLKIKHFIVDIPEHISDVTLLCGAGTSVDTKRSKNIKITYPRWLHNLIHNYIFTEEAVKRREKWLGKTLRINPSTEEAYVFITNRGAPYFEDNVDRNIFNPNQTAKKRPDGSTVRTFIADELLPNMKKVLGLDYSFSFHDLRATFGMNLTDSLLNRVQKGQITLTEARNIVRDAMGHDSYSTTDIYLSYRKNIEIVSKAQTEYESYLSSLIRRVKEGFYEKERDF